MATIDRPELALGRTRRVRHQVSGERSGNHPGLRSTFTTIQYKFKRRYKKRSAPIKDTTWQTYRSRVQQIYITEGKTENETRAILADRWDFRPSKRQLVAQLGVWQVRKHERRLTNQEVQEVTAEAPPCYDNHALPSLDEATPHMIADSSPSMPGTNPQDVHDAQNERLTSHGQSYRSTEDTSATGNYHSDVHVPQNPTTTSGPEIDFELDAIYFEYTSFDFDTEYPFGDDFLFAPLAFF